MKTRNQTSTRKCSERAVWMLNGLLIALEPRRQRGRHAEPGDERERRGDEDGDEVGEQLQAVVGDPAVVERPVQREVLDQHRDGVREDIPARRHESPPLAAREQQDVEDEAVEQPEHVDAEMPPAREADRVAKPRQPDLRRQADRVLLRRPQRIGRHRLLDAKPVPAGRRVARPVQPRMIGEDLHAGADDEDQQEQIEEVLQPQPDRETRRHVRVRRLDGPGVPRDEVLNDGSLRRPFATATATISSRNPIGSSQSRLNHLVRPMRTRGAIPFTRGIEPAQVAVSITSSPGVSCQR